MNKEFNLSETEKNLLWEAGQQEDRVKEVNKAWDKIARAKGFLVKTLRQGNVSGVYTADFIEKIAEPEEMPMPSLFDHVQEDKQQPSKKDVVTQEDDDDKTAPVKMKTLISENFKKLNIVIEANGRSFEVRGDNGIGKSSVIDAIFTTLLGMKGSKLEEPIQKGQDQADNIVELETQKVIIWNEKVLPKGTIIQAERKFTSGGNKLNVRIDGKRLSSPKELMEFLVGTSSIADPTALWEMKPVDLKKYLTQVSGIANKLDLIEIEKKSIYHRKYEVEQEIERFDKELVDYEDVPDDVKEPKFDEIQESIRIRTEKGKVISEKVVVLGMKRQEAEASDNKRLSFQGKLVDIAHEITELERQITEKKAKIKLVEIDILAEDKIKLSKVEDQELIRNAIDELMLEISELPDRTEELNNLQLQEKLFTRFGIKKTVVSRKAAAIEKQTGIMDEVKEVEDKRSALFISAEMPIKGLYITEEGVEYNGVPLTKDQISEAEGLELCMDILIAQNPRLRLIACKYGHAFSQKTLHRVLKKAKYKDYQLIIERVSDSESLEVEFIEL